MNIFDYLFSNREKMGEEIFLAYLDRILGYWYLNDPTYTRELDCNLKNMSMYNRLNSKV